MKRSMILFAMGFPYLKTREPFLENEYPLYREQFDKVLLMTSCKKNEQSDRKVTDPTIEIIRDCTQSRDFLSILSALPHMLTDKMFYRELKHLFSVEGFSFQKLCSMLIVSLSANHMASQAFRWIKKHPEYQPKVIYGYWMQIPAYATIRLNQKLGNSCYTVSRTHRFDLYSEVSQAGYLPFHWQFYQQLDEVASISDDGKKYLENKYGNLNKVSVHHLGALDREKHNPETSRTPFRIVSCARTVPVKRLNRIIDALSQITDKEICWTHLGGGTCLEELKEYAANRLPANISANFTGTIPNTQVYETYASEPFHVFINVSESEGVPVSIMEAMSFDIPVIATAVGGTPELMEEGKNGYLLTADFSDSELTAHIRGFMDMSNEEYHSFRVAARNKFERDYNAIPNYRKFIEHLASK